MKQLEVPEKLRKRVTKFYNYMWRRQKTFNFSIDGQPDFLSEIPQTLKSEIQLCLNQAMVEKVPFFQGCEPLFINTVVEKLTRQLNMPGDNIVVEGEKGDAMFFISSGEVEIVIGSE